MILKLDVDRGMTPLSIGALTWRLRAAGVRPVCVQQMRSASGTGWHVRVRVRPAPRTAMEVVALQAVCGSDGKREACNVTRARLVDGQRVSPFWRRRWNVLYQ